MSNRSKPLRVNPWVSFYFTVSGAQKGAEYLHRSLVVRTPNIGGAENGACFAYPLPTTLCVGALPRLKEAVPEA